MLLILTEGYSSASLLQRANEFVVQNFHDLSMTPDFLDMPVGMLEVCLGSDSLSVPSEEVAVSLSSAPDMGKPRTMHTCVTTLGRLYVLGGRTRGERDGAPSLMEIHAQKYRNPHTHTHIPLTLPVASYYPESSAIYTLGSSVEISDSFNPSLDCFLRYDAVSDQWSHLLAEFGQFFHATLVKAVSVNNTLHLCDLSMYKVYSFCLETCVWQGEGSFECARCNVGAVGMANRIYILGGDYSPDEITDEVQAYHSGRGQWEEVTPMPHPLTEFHCQVISFNRYRDP
ncbi:kelch repeat and BTB domain-containing protein 3-like, partial [Coregonus clupeaformis]|uniref:kelch repeat and BTB domain-containing protein 3-like n=1 Tax=Coregonus clupeaformis TaxID=59861 RepID=UPI001E1C2E75